MPLHQKLLTVVLLLLTGMILGVLFMIYRGSWIPPERVEVRYTDVKRSSEPVDPVQGEEHYSPSFLFNDVAEEIIPAVVYIESEITVDRDMPDDEFHDFEDQFWERFLPRQRAQSIGSGVLISGDGYILTNHHVIQGAERRVRVMTHDKKEHEARIIGSDPSTDLAVIKIDADQTSAIVIGNSDHVRIGDWVMAIGNPFRLRSTVTAGIVSATGRDVDIISDRMRIESFIQTDAAINRGNSGGALVNTRGELVGINTAIASESGSYQGYGFAVPVNLAMKIGQDIIEYGEVQRAYLGVEILSLDHDRAKRAGLDKVEGVEIRNLAPEGSADRGGLKRGDVVLAVNGHTVGEANRLQERIAMLRPGDAISLKVWRDGSEKEISFPLLGKEVEAVREWASAEPGPRSDEQFRFDPDEGSGVRQSTFESGFTVAELPVSDNLSEYGLVVIRVEPGSSAYESGIQQEDIIQKINSKNPSGLDEFSEIMNDFRSADETIDLELYRDGETVEIEL